MKHIKHLLDIVDKQRDHIALGLMSQPGLSKAQPLDITIPTPNGYKAFGELKVGDEVFSSEGFPTKVTEIHPQGIKQAYKVTLSDGRSTECCMGHLWSVYDGDWLMTMTLEDIVNNGIMDGNRHLVYIPMNLTVNYQEAELKCDPYVLGAYIGNGCSQEKRFTISAMDDHIPNKIASILGCEAVKLHENNYSYAFKLPLAQEAIGYMKNSKYYPKHDFVRTCDVIPWELDNLKSREKFIPVEYLTASVEQREALLTGLLDTDGSISKPEKGNVTYDTFSKSLAEDVVELCASLGMSANIKSYKDNDYLVYIRMENYYKQDVFTQPHKLARAVECSKYPRKVRYDRIAIHSVEPTRKVEMQCIKVAAKNELYLTEHYITTHNTSQVKQWAEENGRTYHELIISQRMPSEISGMPMPVDTTRTMEIFDYNLLLDLKDGDVLAFDEFTNGNIQTLNACLTLIQERVMLSGKKLPSILIVAMGNPSGSCDLLPQTKQRFWWVDVTFDTNTWVKYMIKTWKIRPNNVISGWIKDQYSDGFNSTTYNYYTPRTMENLFRIAQDIPEEDKFWLVSDVSPIVVSNLYKSLGGKDIVEALTKEEFDGLRLRLISIISGIDKQEGIESPSRVVKSIQHSVKVRDLKDLLDRITKDAKSNDPINYSALYTKYLKALEATDVLETIVSS
jgi:MoxR-like ATPase